MSPDLMAFLYPILLVLSLPHVADHSFLPHSPPIWLSLSCFSSSLSSSSSFVSLSSFPADSSSPLCSFLKLLCSIFSGSLSNPLPHCGFHQYLSPDTSLYLGLDLPGPHSHLAAGSIYVGVPLIPQALCIPKCALPSLTLLLDWLMRQKISVPFIHDSRSWGILAGNFGRASRPSARKYPPWTSLKS